MANPKIWSDIKKNAPLLPISMFYNQLLLHLFSHTSKSHYCSKCNTVNPESLLFNTSLLTCSAGDPPAVTGHEPYPGSEEHGPSQRGQCRPGWSQTPGEATESQTHMSSRGSPQTTPLCAERHTSTHNLQPRPALGLISSVTVTNDGS